jgi:hypothetical protein
MQKSDGGVYEQVQRVGIHLDAFGGEEVQHELFLGLAALGII